MAKWSNGVHTPACLCSNN